MDMQRINDQMEKELKNGVKNVEIAKIEEALWSHFATGSTTQMVFKEAESEDSFMGEVLNEKYGEAKDQDVLIAGFEMGVEGFDAFFFPAHDLVVMLDEEDGELVAEMTISNFFKFYNTLPNPYMYAEETSWTNRPTKEGLFLLSHYAQKH